MTATVCRWPGCDRPVVARGVCRRHYHAERGGVEPHPEVGAPSGHGRWGVMERGEDTVLCHECGGWYASVGSHAATAHGLTAAEYRRRHGIPRTAPLVSLSVSRALSESAAARVGSAQWRRFEEARDPLAASQARDRDAMRSGGLARGDDSDRLPRRAPREKTCPGCGVTYTGPARTCGAQECVTRVVSEAARRQALASRPQLSEADVAELRSASGAGLDVVVRRLQDAGVSSASIGRVLGRSGAWMSEHYPRREM